MLLVQKAHFLKKFIYLAALGLSCSMQDFFLLIVVTSELLVVNMGSSSLTRDSTWDPCLARVEFYPLDHQGSLQKPHFREPLDYEIRTEIVSMLRKQQ